MIEGSKHGEVMRRREIERIRSVKMEDDIDMMRRENDVVQREYVEMAVEGRRALEASIEAGKAGEKVWREKATEAVVGGLAISNMKLDLELKKRLAVAADCGEKYMQVVCDIQKERCIDAYGVSREWVEESLKEIGEVIKGSGDGVLGIGSEIWSNRCSEELLRKVERVYRGRVEQMKERVEVLMEDNIGMYNVMVDMRVREKMGRIEADRSEKEKELLRKRVEQYEKDRESVDNEIKKYRYTLEHTDSNNSVIPICDKLIELQQYLGKIDHEQRTKSEEVARLEVQTKELKHAIGDLLRLECDIGYEKLREVPQLYKKCIEDYERMEKECREMREEVRKGEEDRQNKEYLIERLVKENKMLLYLNQKLCEEWKMSDPTANTARYGRDYFLNGSKQVTCMYHSEAFASIDEVYEQNRELRKNLGEVRMAEKSVRNDFEKLRDELNIRERDIEVFKKKLENQSEERRSGDEGGEREVGVVGMGFGMKSVHGVNEGLLVDENKMLKDHLKEVSMMNSKLNLSIVENEIDIEKRDAIIEDLRKDLQTVRMLYHTSMSEMSELKNETLKRLEFDNKKLEREKITTMKENGLLLERVNCFKEAFKSLNEYYVTLDDRKSEERNYIQTLVSLVDEEMWGTVDQARRHLLMDEEAVENIKKVVHYQMLDRIHSERETLLDFKIQAHMSYIGILENKLNNMENVVKEFMEKILDLQKERDDLETNSVLERVKQYLEMKSNELEKYREKLETNLTMSNELNVRMSKDVGDADSLNEEIKSLMSGRVEEIRVEYQKRFNEIIEKSETSMELVKREYLSKLDSKEKELIEMKQKVETGKYEERSELTSKLEMLTKAVEVLRKEAFQYRSLNRMMDLNLEAVEKSHKEMVDELIIRYESKISSIKKQLVNYMSQVDTEQPTKETLECIIKFINEKIMAV